MNYNWFLLGFLSHWAVRAASRAMVLVLGVSCLITGPPLYAADPAPAVPTVSATVIEGNGARGILGRTVQGADGKEIGRVIDVVVDGGGRTRAAIVDFGGFLGVGSRKIAVSWNALHFGSTVRNDDAIRLELAQDQLKAAPEYKEGNPIVVIGATGSLESLDLPPATTPEK